MSWKLGVRSWKLGVIPIICELAPEQGENTKSYQGSFCASSQ